METQHIDSIFKKAINESGNFYDTQASKAKEGIWNQVQLQKPKLIKPYVFRLLAAACLLLFICTGVVVVSNIKSKSTIKQLVAANTNLQNEAKLSSKSILANNNTVIAPDTVYIEKRVLVNTPLIIAQIITDTVYVNQIVYVEKEPAQELIATTEDVFSGDSLYQKNKANYKMEVLISNTDVAKKKKKKMRIKFGGNKEQAAASTLGFTAGL